MVATPPDSMDRPLALRTATSGRLDSPEIMTSSQAPLMYFRSGDAMLLGPQYLIQLAGNLRSQKGVEASPSVAFQVGIHAGKRGCHDVLRSQGSTSPLGLISYHFNRPIIPSEDVGQRVHDLADRALRFRRREQPPASDSSSVAAKRRISLSARVAASASSARLQLPQTRDLFPPRRA